MTQNQIAYQQLQETQRHNKVNEDIDRTRAILSPISSLIGSVIPSGKYIIGGRSNGKRSQIPGQTRLW